VLEGAVALALPINKYQSLEFTKTTGDRVLTWNAKHKNGNWFDAIFDLSDFDVISTSDTTLAGRLASILKKARRLNPGFLNPDRGIKVETYMGFLPWHGLGSSSTLINNIAQWADIDAYKLQKITFRGSGYDIACARSGKPLFFQLVDGDPVVEETGFKPVFQENIYFVYLGKKQRSLESIKDFKANAGYSVTEISEISDISRSMAKCQKQSEFNFLVENHERIMAGVLGRPGIKSVVFDDFEGSVKSLGGWGGDFVMMTTEMGKTGFKAYLMEKKLTTFYSFSELSII
jgi:mevalonate kinase